jgi:CRP-like cAMP-binding protein
VQVHSALASLFSDLDTAGLRQLGSVMAVHGFRCSEQVISVRRGCQHLAVLVEGRLRVCSVTSTGRQVTLHRHGPGSILGLANLVPETPPEVDAVAETDGVLLRAPVQDIAALMPQLPHLPLVLLREAIRQLCDVEEFARRLSESSVERRVAAALLETPVSPDGAPVPREHLASRAAASRESVSRALQRFAARGVVELHGRRVRLRDQEALRRLASRNQRVPDPGERVLASQ